MFRSYLIQCNQLYQLTLLLNLVYNQKCNYKKELDLKSYMCQSFVVIAAT